MFSFYKISITCKGPLGEAFVKENNVPAPAVEGFIGKVVDRLYDQYRAVECITEKTEQSHFEVKQSDFDYKASAYAISLKEALHRRTHPKTITQSPLWSVVGTFGMTFCGGVFAYQSMQTIVALRKRNVKLALKHGVIATVSGITIAMFGNLLLRL